MDDSNKSDGQSANETMHPVAPREGVFIGHADLARLHERLAAVEVRPQITEDIHQRLAKVENFQPRMSAGVTSELHQRLAAVESAQVDLHGKVDNAVKSGHLDANLLEKVSHVIAKYFPHDDPPGPEVVPLVERFDRFTGQPLN